MAVSKILPICAEKIKTRLFQIIHLVILVHSKIFQSLLRFAELRFRQIKRKYIHYTTLHYNTIQLQYNTMQYNTDCFRQVETIRWCTKRKYIFKNRNCNILINVGCIFTSVIVFFSCCIFLVRRLWEIEIFV